MVVPVAGTIVLVAAALFAVLSLAAGRTIQWGLR
jgi:hypothetical protein